MSKGEADPEPSARPSVASRVTERPGTGQKVLAAARRLYCADAAATTSRHPVGDRRRGPAPPSGPSPRTPSSSWSAAGCTAQDKAGRDAGELAGTRPARRRRDHRRRTRCSPLDADCVVYAPLMPDEQLVCRILAAGTGRRHSAGLGLPARGRQRWKRPARKAASTLHGTGIHPGGITERFPLMVSALSASITHVRAEEFSDIRTYGAPAVLRDIMLFGSPPEAARTSPMVGFLGGGLPPVDRDGGRRAGLPASTRGPSRPTRSRWRPRRSTARWA